MTDVFTLLSAIEQKSKILYYFANTKLHPDFATTGDVEVIKEFSNNLLADLMDDMKIYNEMRRGVS